MTRVLLILLATATAIAQPPMFAQTKSPPPSGQLTTKKPDASSAANFKPAELTKLAVIVTATGNRPGGLGGQNSPDLLRLVEDAFLECLLAKGYTLAVRSDVDSVLREKTFQESGATEALAASIGKMLNVPAVLLVRITDLSSDRLRGTMATRASLGARLVSVETGSILWTGSHANSSPTVSRSGAEAVLLGTAVALAEAIPDKPKSGNVQLRTINANVVPKVAVLMLGAGLGPPQAQDLAQNDRDREVEDVFVQVLVQKGYNVVSRSDLQALAKEQAFQNSGLTDDNAVAAGKLLNVPAVLLVGITETASETVSGATSGNKSATGGGGPGRRGGGGERDQGRGGKGGRGVPPVPPVPSGQRGQPGNFPRAAVSARLVDVASGEVRWTHAEIKSRAVAGKVAAANLLAEVARDVAQFLPPEPDTPRELLAHARRLELLGQITAARRGYRDLIDHHTTTDEGKQAVIRLKAIGN